MPDQTEPIEHPNLIAALAAAQAEFPVVAKGRSSGGGGMRFTYATLADYADAIYPVLSRHGLAYSCSTKWIPERGFHIAASLMHVSGDEREAVLPLTGMKPQEIGASLSYSRRQLLAALTGAVADDEHEAEKKQAEIAKRAENPNARKSTRAKAASAAAPVGAGTVDEGRVGDPWAAGLAEEESGGTRINTKQSAAMHALFKEIGVESREERLEKTGTIVGRLVSSSTELSHGEAATLLDALTKRRDDLIADGTIAKPEAGPCSVCNGINGSHSRTCPAGSSGAH